MRDIQLKCEAKEAATRRGHDMKRWERNTFFTAQWGTRCRKCGAGVWVNLHPLPNETEIVGPALAVGCKTVLADEGFQACRMIWNL
ncbi:hypothetical protein LCGC14_1566830 [marine sediment metagenome]|uniref:Uncharacterized protein n=1 Tax=marine sediment metagenome TaxID=412755 RepID=A0A0F9IKS6_9ZZZZ